MLTYRIECIEDEPNQFYIHLEHKLNCITKAGKTLLYDFDGSGYKSLSELPQYLLDILNTNGILNVVIGTHHIIITVAELYTLKQVLPAILHILAYHMEGYDQQIVQSGEPFMIITTEDDIYVRVLVDIDKLNSDTPPVPRVD